MTIPGRVVRGFMLALLPGRSSLVLTMSVFRAVSNGKSVRPWASYADKVSFVHLRRAFPSTPAPAADLVSAAHGMRSCCGRNMQQHATILPSRCCRAPLVGRPSQHSERRDCASSMLPLIRDHASCHAAYPSTASPISPHPRSRVILLLPPLNVARPLIA